MKKLERLPSVSAYKMTDHSPQTGEYTRRQFLVLSGAGIAATAAMLPWKGTVAAISQDVPTSADFHTLCQFLTAKSLNTALTERAFNALVKVDDTFKTRLIALNNYVAEKKFNSVEDFKAASDLPSDAKKTALEIISSLYMGYTGVPADHLSVDNTAFVTYTQALTFRLTSPYTPIPSYSRWGTGYWTTIPKRNS